MIRKLFIPPKPPPLTNLSLGEICRIFNVPPRMVGLRPQRLYILTVIPARPRREDEGLTFTVEITAKNGLAAVKRFLHYAPGCAIIDIRLDNARPTR